MLVQECGGLFLIIPINDEKRKFFKFKPYEKRDLDGQFVEIKRAIKNGLLEDVGSRSKKVKKHDKPMVSKSKSTKPPKIIKKSKTPASVRIFELAKKLDMPSVDACSLVEKALMWDKKATHMNLLGEKELQMVIDYWQKNYKSQD